MAGWEQHKKLLRKILVRSYLNTSRKVSNNIPPLVLGIKSRALCVRQVLYHLSNIQALILYSILRHSLTMLPRLASNFKFSYISLLRNEVAGMYHHTWLICRAYLSVFWPLCLFHIQNWTELQRQYKAKRHYEILRLLYILLLLRGSPVG